MRRRNKNNPLTLAAYGVALIGCIGIVGYIGFQAYGKPVADELGCYPELPQNQTHVLVDVSEPRFDEEQQRALKRYFDKLYVNLGFNERLSFYTTEGDQVASVLSPRFSVCGQAKSGQELEAYGAQGGTFGYLAKQRQKLYETILNPQLEALFSLNPDESRRQREQSPILEMIADLSHSIDLKAGNRLIVISDMIQNSESAQFCAMQNHMPSFKVFEQKKIYQERLKPSSLDGIKAEILMLQRYGFGMGGLRFCHSEEELKTFWRDYLTTNGVSNPNIIRIRQGFGQ